MNEIFTKHNTLTKAEKKLIIEMICNTQTHKIIKNPSAYETDKYKKLEALKIKIKDMPEVIPCQI